MLKQQIIISLAIIAVAIWIVVRINDKKKNNNEETDNNN
jgi:flagellar biogenesis protein FliO